MIPRNATILLTFALALIFSSCIFDSDDSITGYGTVEFIELEEGFYGIIATDGNHYDPANLPSEFMRDGLKVWFLAKISDHQAGTHMWGTIIEIIDIKKID